ncbi:MAG: hypothetical protein HFJ34_01060 [Clostridia bacterium]|nr:hypothetical protein [Clostridia bacterium]
MVIKMTNKQEKFYQYMGKFFGSRLIEKQTNDRIYDDDNKEWYIYLEEERVMAFVSVNNNVIKNVYTTKEKYLEEILMVIKKDNVITYSIVTNYYKPIYEKCGFKVSQNQDYKNFITIYMEKEVALLLD